MRRIGVASLGLLLSLCLFSREARAQADHLIYADALANGWQDWSWSARDFNSTDFVHGGARSAKVTYTAGWQGFYLRHTPFDSSQFTALTFWINGGAVSGRNITVAAQLNDVAQPAVSLNTYIAGGSVAAATWRKVTIPLSALQVDNRPNMTGFWLQDAGGSAQPAFYVDDITLTGAPVPSEVHVNVDAANVGRAVDSRIFGVNAAIWDAAFNTPETVSLLGAINPKVMRFPGGSLSNNYHWLTNTTDNNTWQWATGFDDFASVARAIGSQAFISVNYGSGTAQEAADWVRYSNITRGYGFKYWEIGNENYGSWERDDQSRPHDPFTYATRARDYINQMKAVDPAIKVGVVVVAGEDSFANYTDHPVTNPRTGQTHNGWTPVLLTRMKTLGVTPDFVVYHKYDQGPGAESDSALLQSASSWAADAAGLRQQLSDYLGAQNAAVEIVCTENNSVFSGPGKQTTSLVNGLFRADSVGQILQTEFKALVWWDVRNGQESGNNNSPSLYGWRAYGDYGMVSPQNDPYPTYYVSKLLTHFAAGGDVVVRATSDYNLLSAYAVKRGDGRLTLLVINKSPTNALNASVNLAGYMPQAAATVYSYGIPQDEAARTGVGSRDVAESTFGGAASSFTYSFAPYSATVLSFTPALCVAVSQTSLFFPVSGGSGSVAVTAPGNCAWSAASNADWIIITSGEDGAGNDTVGLEVRENFTASPRTATMTIAGRTVTVIQDSETSADCSFTLSPAAGSFASSGGTGTITVAAEGRCAWRAVSNASWITVTSEGMGIGGGSINYSVAANPSASGRRGTITAAGVTFSVKQKGS